MSSLDCFFEEVFEDFIILRADEMLGISFKCSTTLSILFAECDGEAELSESGSPQAKSDAGTKETLKFFVS